MNDIESIVRRLIREEIRAAFEEFISQIPSPSALQKPASDERLLLSTRDAAKMLGISDRTLFSLTQSEQLPCVRIGSSKRYSIETLKKWIQATEAQPATHPQREKKARIEAEPRATVTKTSKKAVRRTKANRSASKAEKASKATIDCAISQENSVREESQNPFSILLQEIGVSRSDLPTVTNGELRRIAGVDIPTLHGWQWHGRSLPPDAIQRLREHFSKFKKHD